METLFDGYVTAALWSSTDESDENGGDPLDKNYTAQDIEPDTLAQMRSDCEQFTARYGNEIARAKQIDKSYTDGHAGHDFWLTRNGHGAGFWDRELGVIGDTLTLATEAFGEYNLYVGDNGEIYGG